MATYIRAKCLGCEKVNVLTYDQTPAPPVSEGDVFVGGPKHRCIICGESRFSAIERLEQ